MGDLAPFFNEDCLTLNVYVPAGNSATGSRSVMVWIHGGAFYLGGAWGYAPSELVTENDVIVVVIQYRLGILGFLSSGDNIISGNYGMLDQTLAIRWVKDNIWAFGGDPDSITLFGESAGAMSIGFHMLSPHSRGLFSRAILQSGSPLVTAPMLKNPLKTFYYVANKTGCTERMSWSDRAYYRLTGSWQQAEHQSILDCLRRLDWKTILPLTNPSALEFGFESLEPWWPVVDGDFLPRDPFFLTNDAEYLAAVGATGIDVMSGITNDEGGYLIATAVSSVMAGEVPGASKDMIVLKELFSDARNLSRAVIEMALRFYFEELQNDPRRLELVTDVVEFFYLQPIFEGQTPKIQDVVNVITDTYFLAPAIQFTRALAAAKKKMSGRSPAGRDYLYLFNHYPASRAGDEVRGTFHAEDISYEFDGTPYTPRNAFNAEDYTVGTTFRSMISNFAKIGDPQVVVDRQLGETWPQFTLEEEKYLSLEVTPRVADHLYAKRAALLLELVPSLVNSTRVSEDSSWRMPWQQGQQAPFTGTRTFSFKGRLNFFKLN